MITGQLERAFQLAEKYKLDVSTVLELNKIIAKEIMSSPKVEEKILMQMLQILDNNKMILIGSRAYAYVYKDFTRTTGFTDYDVVMTKEKFKEWFKKHKHAIASCVPSSESKYKAVIEKDNQKVIYEIEVGNGEGESQDFLLQHIDDVTLPYGTYTDFLGDEYRVLNGRFLGLTKKSHIYYPIHFEKNIVDYMNICKIRMNKIKIKRRILCLQVN